MFFLGAHLPWHGFRVRIQENYPPVAAEEGRLFSLGQKQRCFPEYLPAILLGEAILINMGMKGQECSLSVW